MFPVTAPTFIKEIKSDGWDSPDFQLNLLMRIRTGPAALLTLGGTSYKSFEYFGLRCEANFHCRNLVFRRSMCYSTMHSAVIWLG